MTKFRERFFLRFLLMPAIFGCFLADVIAQESAEVDIETELLGLGEKLLEAHGKFGQRHDEIFEPVDSQSVEEQRQKVLAEQTEYFTNGKGKVQSTRFTTLFEQWLPTIAPRELLSEIPQAEQNKREESSNEEIQVLNQIEALISTLQKEKDKSKKDEVRSLVVGQYRIYFERINERKLNGMSEDHQKKINDLFSSVENCRDILQLESTIRLIQAWKLSADNSDISNEIAKLSQVLLKEFASNESVDTEETEGAFSSYIGERKYLADQLRENCILIGNYSYEYHQSDDDYLNRIALLDQLSDWIAGNHLPDAKQKIQIVEWARHHFVQMKQKGFAGPVVIQDESWQRLKEERTQMVAMLQREFFRRKSLETEVGGQTVKQAVISRLSDADGFLFSLTSDNEACKKVSEGISQLLKKVHASNMD